MQFCSMNSMHSAEVFDLSSMSTLLNEMQPAIYQSQPVQVLRVAKPSVTLQRKDLHEMKLVGFILVNSPLMWSTYCNLQMHQMVHENICPFVGACVEPGNVCLLYGFCARGSLQVSRVIQ